MTPSGPIIAAVVFLSLFAVLFLVLGILDWHGTDGKGLVACGVGAAGAALMLGLVIL